MATRYVIYFYEPGSVREGVQFESETPFQSVAVGDELLGIIWKDSAYPFKGADELAAVGRVTKILRQLWSSKDGTVNDQVTVFSDVIRPD